MKKVLTVTAAAIGLLFLLCGNAAEWAESAWSYFEANVLPYIVAAGTAVTGTGILTVLQKRYINKGMASVYLTQKEYGRQTEELVALKKDFEEIKEAFGKMKTESETLRSEIAETTRLVRGAIASSVKLVQSGEAKALLGGGSAGFSESAEEGGGNDEER